VTTTVPRQTALEIAGFVEQVRTHLGDLTEEEREELTGGLEADLADQLADGAVWSDLGDARSYAAELRQAAGLPAAPRRLPRPVVPTASHVEAALDRCRSAVDRVVQADGWTRGAWSVLVELRPVWWVARAWIAVTLLDVVAGPYEPVSVVPSLVNPLLGPVLLAAAVLGSVLVGLGRVWPGSGPDRPIARRVVLVVLNVLAILAPVWMQISMPGYVVGYYDDGYDDYGAGYAEGRASVGPGLHLGQKRVTNVFAYGPGGKPIPAVQLFDQDGQPLAQSAEASTGRGAERRAPCPAYNGATPLFNVFPLDQVALRRGTCEPETKGRTTPTPPLAEVPPLETTRSGAGG